MAEEKQRIKALKPEEISAELHKRYPWTSLWADRYIAECGPRVEEDSIGRRLLVSEERIRAAVWMTLDRRALTYKKIADLVDVPDGRVRAWRINPRFLELRHELADDLADWVVAEAESHSRERGGRDFGTFVHMIVEEWAAWDYPAARRLIGRVAEELRAMAERPTRPEEIRWGLHLGILHAALFSALESQPAGAAVREAWTGALDTPITGLREGSEMEGKTLAEAQAATLERIVRNHTLLLRAYARRRDQEGRRVAAEHGRALQEALEALVDYCDRETIQAIICTLVDAISMPFFIVESGEEEGEERT